MQKFSNLTWVYSSQLYTSLDPLVKFPAWLSVLFFLNVKKSWFSSAGQESSSAIISESAGFSTISVMAMERQALMAKAAQTPKKHMSPKIHLWGIFLPVKNSTKFIKFQGKTSGKKTHSNFVFRPTSSRWLKFQEVYGCFPVISSTILISRFFFFRILRIAYRFTAKLFCLLYAQQIEQTRKRIALVLNLDIHMMHKK